MALTPPSKPNGTSTSIFGLSDGLVASLAIVLVAAGEGRKVVLLALFGLLIAEGLGMAASQYLADPHVSLRQASIMGASTGASIALVGVPWCFATGSGAILGSCIVAVGIASVISWLRPEGWQSWGQTFSILIAVSAIAAGVGHFA